MSCRIFVKSANESEASWQATWNVETSKTVQPDQSFQSADIVFTREFVPCDFLCCDSSSLVFLEFPKGDRIELHAADLGHPNAFAFLLDTLNVTLHATASKAQCDQTAIKLVTPIDKGNIILADILRQRMQDVEYIEKTATFAKPLQQFDGQKWTPAVDLLGLIRGSIGAIRLLTTSSAMRTVDESLLALESELYNRLPSPLVIHGLRRRTLAFLEGSGFLPNTGGCSTQFYTAAKSLGVDVIVLGPEGHWLQGTEYQHWRKAFIPIEFGHDVNFPSRIVDAVRKYPGTVEGILTCFDSYNVAVSQAAAQLGVPHEPSTAYEIATDKFNLSASQGRKSFKAASIHDVLEIAQTEELPWPVIIKPCRGWGSELVFQVNNIDQLAEIASTIDPASTSHGSELLIEPYCNGPEVDINFAIYDGEVLFWEIGDENPKTADAGSDSFHELDCVSPSELPEKEQHILRDSITNTLLKLGFRNGIYHCEARVHNSTCEWRTSKSGSPTLVPRSEMPTEPPSCFLMDCNIRPPGLNSSDIIETTWGVDYWALLIAIPLRESERVKALAQPFRRGPAYFADMIFVSAEFDVSKKGIWESGAVTEELKQRRPDLGKHISKALTYKKKGDVIPHPSTGTNTFVAYLNIFSRESREHVLNIATEVRKEISNSIQIS